MPYLAYEEPGITVILSLTAFLLCLNASRCILDHVLYCGLIGEILVGVVWGEPVGGTAWLSEGTQGAIQSFGYLGLICLVFEGGLSTDPAMLRKALGTSISIATVGLLMPIGLSFILLAFPFDDGNGNNAFPTPLAAFSAGASLCSTSLGTTFAVLSAAKLEKSRIGVVLVGAAMMDDIVGLVMVNIVTTLGQGGTAGWAIARPIVASFGMLLVTLVLVHFVLNAGLVGVVKFLSSRPSGHSRKLSSLVHTIPHLQFVLSILVLLIYVTVASFINASVLFAAFIAGAVVNYLSTVIEAEHITDMYHRYYRPAAEFVLVPFFFASIGFSIPITEMFSGSIVWKGFVYAILMTLAKLSTALIIYAEYFISYLKSDRLCPCLPHSDAMLLAFAMVSRGEIGFLIASLAQSSGTFSLEGRSGEENMFLVVVWAVVICTIVGPVTVGIIARRKRRDVVDNRLVLEPIPDHEQRLDNRQPA